MNCSLEKPIGEAINLFITPISSDSVPGQDMIIKISSTWNGCNVSAKDREENDNRQSLEKRSHSKKRFGGVKLRVDEVDLLHGSQVLNIKRLRHLQLFIQRLNLVL